MSWTRQYWAAVMCQLYCDFFSKKDLTSAICHLEKKQNKQNVCNTKQIKFLCIKMLESGKFIKLIMTHDCCMSQESALNKLRSSDSYFIFFFFLVHALPRHVRWDTRVSNWNDKFCFSIYVNGLKQKARCVRKQNSKRKRVKRERDVRMRVANRANLLKAYATMAIYLYPYL